VGQHHVKIRTGQLTIELQAEDADFMGRQCDAWAQALINGSSPATLSEANPVIAQSVSLNMPLVEPAQLPPLPPDNLAIPAENPTIPESVILPLPQPSDHAVLPTPVEPVATVAAPERELSTPALSNQDTNSGIAQDVLGDAVTPGVECSVDFPDTLIKDVPVTDAPTEASDAVTDLAAVLSTPEAVSQQTLPPELEAFYGPVSPDAAEEPTADNDFSQVLNQVMADLNEDNDAEPLSDIEQVELAQPSGLIESLADLCDIVHPENSDELLLAAGYYLTYFEGKDSFSLKQLNSQLLLANESSISHSVLAKAIESERLTLVPDPTGDAETPEYALTPDSRQVVEGWLKGNR
jgi:hypothetical protein